MTMAMMMNAVAMVLDRRLCVNTTRGMYLLALVSASHIPEIEPVSTVLLCGSQDRVDIGQCIELGNCIR